ncbi:diaminopimelate decarboxylase [Clostridium sp. HMP27]|uniref:diaminopimelate decarboxylase n=1 Tax=Clostridium sp. HMP27 TaxID=1487921 RepID=UPI00052BDDD7|nr:diaminopimelate decarboxylase [Clostridium sp. HMP27]KGK88857.1 diaminopimelate decarboxylase [Clostridium sp. HMP27]
MNLFGSMEIRENTLYIGGISTVELAEKYGTPLYVFDEGLMRNTCKDYYKYFKVNESNNRVAYAGKAFLTLAMCKLIEEEGLCLDVVSGGELYTAMKANFPADKIYFHGNNKTLEEVEMGIDYGVSRFVVDNFYELEQINKIATRKNKVQKVLLRITPGIEAHTHDYIKTGQIDSKFGFTLSNEDALKGVNMALDLPGIELAGLHCHIGSQIFDLSPYEDEVEIMMGFIKTIKDEFNYEIEELDLGGGFGIYYTEEDEPRSTKEYCETIINKADEAHKRLGIKLPMLTIEPGRSIVGNAGITLYTIGSTKNIQGVRKYISVDGGMGDNIRPALYNAKYECVVANRMENEKNDFVTIAGKCCESGDILINDTNIADSESGDVLAMFTTGAYGYSMSSNYNKIPKAAVVFVKDGEARLVCKRQSYEDLIGNEMF